MNRFSSFNPNPRILLKCLTNVARIFCWNLILSRLTITELYVFWKHCLWVGRNEWRLRSVSFRIFDVTNAYTYVWCVNTYISTLRKQRHLTSKHQNSCKISNVEQTNSAITWIKETLFLLHQHESKNRSHLRYDDPKTLSFQNSIILYFPL